MLGHTRVVTGKIPPSAASNPHQALALRHVIFRHPVDDGFQVVAAVVGRLALPSAILVYQSIGRSATHWQGRVLQEPYFVHHVPAERLVCHPAVLLLLCTPLHSCAAEVVGRLAGDALNHNFPQVGFPLGGRLARLRQIHHIAEPAGRDKAASLVKPRTATLLGLIAHIAPFVSAALIALRFAAISSLRSS